MSFTTWPRYHGITPVKPTAPLPPALYLFIPEEYIGQLRLIQNPSLFCLSSPLPSLFGTSGKAGSVLPPTLPITWGGDGDCAKGSCCFPESPYFHPQTGWGGGLPQLSASVNPSQTS